MAAGGTPGNVVLGPGRIYVAPLGTTEPTSASAAMPSAWRAIGYTEDGNAFSTTLTNEPVEVAEEVDPIRYVLSRRVSSLTFAMAEATRANLALALGGGANAANDATSFEPPDPGDEVAIMIVWDSDDDPTTGTNARILFRQCKPGGTVEMVHRKAPAKTLIAVTFDIEKPSSATPFRVYPDATGLAA